VPRPMYRTAGRQTRSRCTKPVKDAQSISSECFANVWNWFQR
jgi:hypothetical protein